MTSSIAHEFHKYNTLNKIHKLNLNKIGLVPGRDLHDQEWQVTEKIHGANFSFIVSDTKVSYARRNSILSEAEYATFYNVSEIIASETPAALCVYNKLKQKDDSIVQIQIFGELFGGAYLNKDGGLITVGINEPVQTSIFYSPRTMFFPFDIYVTRTDGRPEYLNKRIVAELCTDAGFFCPEPMYFKNASEAIKYAKEHVETDSDINAILGLPEIPGTNIREGFVVGPVVPHFEGESDSRINIKVKSSKYNERQKAPAKKLVRENKYNDKIQKYVDMCFEYITENRYINLMSKLGPEQNIRKIAGMLSQDAGVDFIEDLPEDSGLTKKDIKIIKSELAKASLNFVTERHAK